MNLQDKKIRSTQRTNRILSSFRLDKKQEMTVPFDEIVLERDANANLPSRLSSHHHSSVPNNMNNMNNSNNNNNGYENTGVVMGGNKSYSTTNVACQPYLDFGRGSGQSLNGSITTNASTSSGITGSFSSTVSLPDESRRLEGIKESIEDLLQSASAVTVVSDQSDQFI